MKRTKRQIKVAMASLLAMLILSLSANAALTSLTVEQVRVVQPSVVLYCYPQQGQPIQPDASSAFLDANELEYKNEQAAAEIGTTYYVLVDVSGSIYANHFEAVKTQIQRLTNEMGSKDSISVITFGDEVKLQINQAAAGTDLTEKLAELQANEQTTHLYQAITEAIKLSAAEANGLRRRVMLVVSDGAEVSEDSFTLDETQKELRNADFPMYALCMDYAGGESRERFGSFARDTGGELVAFGPENADLCWDELRTKLESCRAIRYTAAGGNKTTVGEHTFLLKVSAQNGTEDYEQKVSVTQWEADSVPPEVRQAVYSAEDNALLVTFSEAVQGGTENADYSVTDAKGETVQVKTIARNGETQLTLYLAQQPAAGTGSLTICNVTDSSMERNALKSDAIPFEAEPVKAEKNKGFVGLIVACVLALLALILAFAAVLFARKKQKQVVVKEEYQKAAPGTQNVQHVVQHVVRHVPAGGELSIDAANCSVLTLQMTERNGQIARMNVPVPGSSIWGRSQTQCDVCIADNRVSKQHCVVEEKQSGIYITDLGSHNGVFVNGVRIGAPRRLNRGDTIRVGDTMLHISDIQLCGVVNAK